LKTDSLKRPEHVCTIQLTETQLDDIARRDKLRRLRCAQEDHINQNQILSSFETSPIISPTTPFSSIQSNSIDKDPISAPDLLKDHLDNEHTCRQKKVSILR
jgi:hypothetical protein